MQNLSRLLFITLLTGLPIAPPALAQTQASGRFLSAAPDAGWTLYGSAILTAPAIDSTGSGWLRLTGNVNQALGAALNTGVAFNAARGVSISFSYAAWSGGSPGADGISLFLYDASSNMGGATSGGGLGYCKGAGGWLGLALDEYGNFSHPQDGCAGGGGPGAQPQSLVLRGPTASANPYVARAAVPQGVDKPEAKARPPAAQVLLTLAPKAQGAGFNVSAHWRADPADAWSRLLDGVDFPYAAPPSLRVGVAASTGGARNIHEVREINVRAFAPPTVAMSFEPASIPRGGTSTLVLRMGSGIGSSAALSGPLTLKLPGGLKIAESPQLGGTCPAVSEAAAGAGTLKLGRGSVVRPNGCTVTVTVAGGDAGQFVALLPSGDVMTDTGFNTSPATATLTVR